jgi:hypothetical protein
MITTVPELLAALRKPGRSRDVVHWQDRYIVSFKNMEVSANVMDEAVETGAIVRVAETVLDTEMVKWVMPEIAPGSESPPQPKRRGRPRKVVSTS